MTIFLFSHYFVIAVFNVFLLIRQHNYQQHVKMVFRKPPPPHFKSVLLNFVVLFPDYIYLFMKQIFIIHLSTVQALRQ